MKIVFHVVAQSLGELPQFVSRHRSRAEAEKRAAAENRASAKGRRASRRPWLKCAVVEFPPQGGLL